MAGRDAIGNGGKCRSLIKIRANLAPKPDACSTPPLGGGLGEQTKQQAMPSDGESRATPIRSAVPGRRK